MVEYTQIQIAAFFKRLDKIATKLQIDGFEFDFEEANWESGSGVIIVSFEDYHSYETLHGEIPVKYLFDDDWENTLKLDQAIADATKLAKEKEREIAAAKKAKEKKEREKAQRKQRYLELKTEFENE